jgi:hypothetical protein
MENTDNQEVMNQTEETPSSWSFVEESEVKEAQQPQAVEAPPTPEAQPEPIQENAPEQVQEQTESYEFDATTDLPVGDDTNQDKKEYREDQIDSAVTEYLSEKLGRDISSLDELFDAQPQQRQLDERIAAIAQFVEETGRSPQDWFLYQQFNPSEMDDMTAIQVQMASDYPNLSQEEIGLLVGSKYKLDTDLHTEDEIRLSKLQLKMDAESARGTISKLRDSYKAPQITEQPEAEDLDLFDEQWMNSMRQSVNDFQGIEFDLGKDKTFRFGLGEKYKSTLQSKQARLDEYFDPYVNQDGSWDYDTLNMHRTLLDNFDTIAKSIYQQGMSDGKRGIVDQAANVSVQTPNQGTNVPTGDPLTKQLTEIMANQNGMKFL